MAEVIHYNDLINYDNINDAKKDGKVRHEGKNYEVGK